MARTKTRSRKSSSGSTRSSWRRAAPSRRCCASASVATALILPCRGGPKAVRRLTSSRNDEDRNKTRALRWWETLLAVYPDFTSDVEEIRDLGDVTIACHNFRGQANGSGAQLEQRHWQVTR